MFTPWEKLPHLERLSHFEINFVPSWIVPPWKIVPLWNILFHHEWSCPTLKEIVPPWNNLSHLELRMISCLASSSSEESAEKYSVPEDPFVIEEQLLQLLDTLHYYTSWRSNYSSSWYTLHYYTSCRSNYSSS